jgi:hypothetical protein
MLRNVAVAALLSALANIGVVRADTFQTFIASGTYNTFAEGTYIFSGSLTLDLTDQAISAAELNIPDVAVDSCGASYCGLLLSYGIAEGPKLNLALLPAGDGPYDGGLLSGIPGGPPGSIGGRCDVDPTPCLYAVTSFSGTLTSTPLPAALPLFGTVLGGAGLLGWRRKRKGAQSPSNR